MKRLVALALLFSSTTQLTAQSEPRIDVADVTRIISTLSADDMGGRATFSEGIDRAAEFIRSEFVDIGLTSLDGNDGFLQTFDIYALTTESVDVTINQQRVAAANITVSVSGGTVAWTNVAAVNVTTVGPRDDLRAVFSSIRRGNADALVLVNPTHASMFGRIKSFMSRPGLKTEPGAGPDLVFVLTEDTNLTSVNIHISSAVERRSLSNVAATIPGRRSDEIVLFSAHYDHIGNRPSVAGDSIANGANDDASGTTAVIELARYFSQLSTPERTLMFVAFTAEEIGGFGSRHFSQQLDPDQIVAMFNIEMIGKPGKDGPNTAWITGFERSDFGRILQRATEGTVYSFYADPYPTQNLFYRSDNATLARLGVPAHSISTTPIDVDRDYHQVSDEVETLDLEHLTNTIRAIAAGARSIVSGDATPTRVDRSQVN